MFATSEGGTILIKTTLVVMTLELRFCTLHCMYLLYTSSDQYLCALSFDII